MSESEQINIIEKPVNPLVEKLKKRQPGNKYRLPSRGLFYTNGELDPDTEDGEVIVYPMTTSDELKLRSRDMLLDGSAVIEVIRDRVPQVLKPEKLLAADVEYLLTCLRRVSYGPFLPFKFKCDKCDHPEAEYPLPLDTFLGKTRELTREEYEQMVVNLDDIFTVKLQPSRFDALIKILQESSTVDFSENIEKMSKWMDFALAALIRSVDGVTDKDLIVEWLSEMDRGLKEKLSEQVQRLNQWGIEFSYTIQCRGCGSNHNVKTDLNPIHFFMLPSSSEIPNEH